MAGVSHKHSTHKNLRMDGPGIYQIRVPGRLELPISDWGEGLSVTVESPQEGPPITNLRARLADQAALQGLLRRLYAMGLPLIEAKWIGPD